MLSQCKTDEKNVTQHLLATNFYFYSFDVI